jgi:hypothetical protein
VLIQYWKSTDHLNTFAADAALPHRAPWRDYNRRVGSSGDTGVWHETFRVAAGQWEVVYDNMPRMGFAAAGEHVPVRVKGDRAGERLRALDRQRGRTRDK